MIICAEIAHMRQVSLCLLVGVHKKKLKKFASSLLSIEDASLLLSIEDGSSLLLYRR